ncbi:Small-conductance mechanosensitive channel [Jannaschia seosinensis]|uniref:Small-conductance mechanosensitive channel n=1 Tax=Jannaschia seosinensis TaxID=313367 RepID=A0A0M7BCN8_9RHOB|nr:mechanosensitive ion channel family protein [Jannaschia seosinensis]CUH39673.1 Small-conductance mechanosensitive channel [Jannaschia seosinensis]
MIRALFLALLLAAPAFAQEAPSQPSGAIATAQNGVSDAAIERRIQDIIAQLEGYTGVIVDVREGVVTLSGEVLDNAAIQRLDEITSRVDGVVAIQNEVVEDTNLNRRLNPVFARFRDRIGQAVAYLPLLAVALTAGLTVMLVGVLFARWEAPWRRIAPNAFIGDIYRVIFRLVFVLAGIVVALDILNATAVLAGFLGAAGIVGLAVGFAVRDTVENFIASIMLSLRQPFRPNDFVDIEGSVGTVIRLTSRATILLDRDGNHLRLPNAVVFKAKIINYTRNAERRFGFGLGIDPNDDLAEAKRIGLETLGSLPFVLVDPPPQVWVKEAGDSTVTMEFFGWVNQQESDFMVARGEALRLVMAALTRADIGLPEPTFRVNLPGGGLPVINLPDTENRSREIVVTEEPAPDQTPPADEVAPVRVIERMVEDERRMKGADDLLSRAAPEE